MRPKTKVGVIVGSTVAAVVVLAVVGVVIAVCVKAKQTSKSPPLPAPAPASAPVPAPAPATIVLPVAELATVQPDLRMVPIQHLVETDLPTNVLFTTNPTLVEIPNFLTKQQAQEIIAHVQERFAPSVVWDASKNTGNQPDPSRTSWSMYLYHDETPLIAAIEAAAARLCHVPKTHLERLQVVRYTRDQFYKAHHDYLPVDSSNVREWGQRIITLCVYLNDLPADEQGGGTNFTLLATTIRPVCGKAVAWSNVSQKGELESNSLHSGEAIHTAHAVKYCLNIWIRDRSQV